MSFHVGEALCGDGNEIAHIDLLIGDKNGPVGSAFANALCTQSQGHSSLPCDHFVVFGFSAAKLLLFIFRQTGIEQFMVEYFHFFTDSRSDC